MARPKTPRHLFHWTTDCALEAMARRLVGRPIPAGSALYRRYPALRGRPALFAWSHPVTGMASHPQVVYAGGDPKGSRLLALRLRPGARVLRLSTDESRGRATRLARGVDSYDLIYHEISFPNGGLIREWIVLWPEAIAGVTANPAVLSPVLRRELRKLKSAAFRYPERFLHDRSAALRTAGKPLFLSITAPGLLREKIVLPRLRAAAALRVRDVPAALRRPMKLRAGGRW